MEHMMTLLGGMNKVAEAVHGNAVEHGWWEEDKALPEIIALCHSELSEALEEYRDGKPVIYCTHCIHPDRPFSEHNDRRCTECLIRRGCIDKPEGIGVELADCMIRILDYCGRVGINIEDMIRIKHQYNKTRAYRHGGKKA